MKAIFSKAAVSALVVLTLIFGGNHCALFAFATIAETTEHSCCESQPVIPEQCSQCCDHLAAPLPAMVSLGDTVVVVSPVAYLSEPLLAPRSDREIAADVVWGSPPGHFFVFREFLCGKATLAPPLSV